MMKCLTKIASTKAFLLSFLIFTIVGGVFSLGYGLYLSYQKEVGGVMLMLGGLFLFYASTKLIQDYKTYNNQG